MLQLILIMNCFLSCRSEQIGIAVFLNLRSAFYCNPTTSSGRSARQGVEGPVLLPVMEFANKWLQRRPPPSSIVCISRCNLADPT